MSPPSGSVATPSNPADTMMKSGLNRNNWGSNTSMNALRKPGGPMSMSADAAGRAATTSSSVVSMCPAAILSTELKHRAAASPSTGAGLADRSSDSAAASAAAAVAAVASATAAAVAAAAAAAAAAAFFGLAPTVTLTMRDDTAAPPMAGPG